MTIVMWLLNIQSKCKILIHTHFRSIIRGVQQQFQNQQTLVSYYTVLLTIVCFYLLYQLGTGGKACTRCLP